MRSTIFFTALFVLVFVAAVTVQAVTIVDPPVDNLIIGAGAAGISAARDLRTAGKNFRILEWSNRIGGRIHTVYGPEDFEFPEELGAMWLQEVDRNPTVALANQLDVDTKKFDQGSVSVFSQGRLLSPEEVGAGVAKYYEIAANATQYFQLGRSNQEAFEMAGYLGDDPLVELIISFFDEQFFADNPSRHDSSYWDRYTSAKPDRTVPTGYVSILDAVIAQHSSIANTIQYNSKVIRIDATSHTGKVLVTYKKRIPQPSDLSAVAIHELADEDASDGCNDLNEDDETKWVRHTVEANNVICTASLGVLRSGKIQFTPPMPAPMQHAVDTLLFGIANKVALFFDDRATERVLKRIKTNYIMRTSTVANPRVNDGLMVFINDMHVRRQPVILSFFQGDYARQLDGLTKQQVVDRHMVALREIFSGPSINATLPDPVKYKISNWSRNNFGGVYTTEGINSTPADFAALKAPIGLFHNVYLAGEHAAYPYNGYVHGAMISGKEAAAAIIAK